MDIVLQTDLRQPKKIKFCSSTYKYSQLIMGSEHDTR